MMNRCGWARNDLAIAYHDEEWGVPVHDDRRWFEFLILEGAQAGLSWDTILCKREHYRRAFAGFDPEAVARFDEARIESLLADPGIVRNPAGWALGHVRSLATWAARADTRLRERLACVPGLPLPRAGGWFAWTPLAR